MPEKVNASVKYRLRGKIAFLLSKHSKRKTKKGDSMDKGQYMGGGVYWSGEPFETGVEKCDLPEGEDVYLNEQYRIISTYCMRCPAVAMCGLAETPPAL